MLSTNKTTVPIRLPREMPLLLFHWGVVRICGPRVIKITTAFRPCRKMGVGLYALYGGQLEAIDDATIQTGACDKDYLYTSE